MATAKKTATATENFETWTAATPEAFKEGFEKITGGFGKWAEFNRTSTEAFAASAGRITKGFEKAASEQSAFVKESYEDGVAAFKAATTSKSVQEAIDVQSEFLRSSFEKNSASSTSWPIIG